MSRKKKKQLDDDQGDLIVAEQRIENQPQSPPILKKINDPQDLPGQARIPPFHPKDTDRQDESEIGGSVNCHSKGKRKCTRGPPMFVEESKGVVSYHDEALLGPEDGAPLVAEEAGGEVAKGDVGLSWAREKVAPVRWMGRGSLLNSLLGTVVASLGQSEAAGFRTVTECCCISWRISQMGASQPSLEGSRALIPTSQKSSAGFYLFKTSESRRD